MSSKGFIVGAGGEREPFAVIGVTYPQGSTCTCTNGTKVLKTKGTGGSFIFRIPSAGTWTVSCTDGTSTASRSFSITNQYQAETVNLAYELYLFRNGAFENIDGLNATDATVTIIDGNIKIVTDNYYSTAAAKNSVDMSAYSTMIFTMASGGVSAHNAEAPKIYIGDNLLLSDGDISGTVAASAIIPSDSTGSSEMIAVGDVSIDISEITGTKDFMLTLVGSFQGAWKAKIYISEIKLV